MCCAVRFLEPTRRRPIRFSLHGTDPSRAKATDSTVGRRLGRQRSTPLSRAPAERRRQAPYRHRPVWPGQQGDQAGSESRRSKAGRPDLSRPRAVFVPAGTAPVRPRLAQIRMAAPAGRSAPPAAAGADGHGCLERGPPTSPGRLGDAGGLAGGRSESE